MSKIGRKSIIFSKKVTASVHSNCIKVVGPKGVLSMKIPATVKVNIGSGVLSVVPNVDNASMKADWGMFRAILNNMIIGVNLGFSKTLKIRGIGYKVIKNGNILFFSLGFCHDIGYVIPEDVDINCNKSLIVVSGIDKQRVGHIAAEIRSLKKPEPYKGKGIMYENEEVLRKEGKKK